MSFANDNIQDNDKDLLAKAREILGDSCIKQTNHVCTLTSGGKCPLIASVMAGLKG